MVQNYLESVKKQFEYYKMLGDKTINCLTDNQLFWQYNPESNSISIIVKHLWGNMMSRWTDFLTADGEKTWRKRDAEFENDIKDRQELLAKWEEGWSCLFEALETVNEINFDTLIYIRNNGHTITEAINRQLTHYAYHIGQLVYIGRMVRGESWESLSIPKGGSVAFNDAKFAKPKKRSHFTDDLLKDKDTGK